MPDRVRIGLDNPAFSGRLRQPSGSAQSWHTPGSAARPSARYFDDFVYNSARQSAYKRSAPTPPVMAKPVQEPVEPVKPKLVTQPQAKQPRKRRTYNRPQLALMSMGVMVFVLGITVSVMTLRTNASAAATITSLSKKADNQPATTDAASSTSNDDLPSTTKPKAASIANYVVGPTMPRYLDIPKLNVHARILSLGILNSGALATPNNVYDTGWYNGSSLPGQPGAALIDGHVSSWTTHGVFYGLKSLVAGDEIKITRGDGTIFTYKVVRTQAFPYDSVDMNSAVRPVDPSKPGLNLITCGGKVIKGTNHFDQRQLVYATQV